MDAATALWMVVPLALIHFAARRRRPLLLFQVAVDAMLLLLPGRVVLRGLHVGPGAGSAPAWGSTVTVAGSAEQSDLPLEFAPWWAEARRLLAAGEPPWISDRIGAGTPLFANGQTGVPFPLHVPVWALGPERGSDVMAVWKLELAALGGFLLLRRFGVRPSAAAAGALSYAFGLYQLSWLVVPLAWVVALAPWSLWALVGTLRGDRRNAAFLALLLGALAGWSVHPETAAFLWLAVALAGAVLAWGRRRRALRLAAPILLAVPVAAVGALPTLATVAESTKLAGARRGPQYPDPGLSWAVKGRAAALLVAPWRDGHPGDGTWSWAFPCAAVSVGVGVAPIVLLAAGRPRRRHRRAALALAAVGACGAALVYQLPGFSHLAGRVPVLDVMTWVRAGFLIGLSVAFLGALGADAWLRAPRRRRLVVAAALAEAAVLALTATGRAPFNRESAAALAAPAALAVLGGLLPAAVPALVVAESAANGWGLLGASRAAPAPAAIVSEMVARAGPGERVLGAGGALPPNLAARGGLSDVRSADPVRPIALGRLHAALGAEGSDLPGQVTKPWAGVAGAWGVRWLVAPPDGVSGAAAAGWEEVYRDAGGRLYRNERALPPLRLATRAIAPAGDPAAGAWEGVDFEHEAVAGAAGALGGDGALTALEDAPSRHAARVRAAGRVLAVLHVPRAPGWRATLDGRDAALLDADLGAMAVVVPAGTHEVRWEYSPPFLAPAAGLTVLGLGGCLALALRSRRRAG